MNQALILWPVVAQVALTIYLYLFLAVVKKREIAAGNVDLKKVALHQEYWPEPVLKINNNLRNQFETPVLFYVVCIVLLSLGAVDMLAMVLASAYVVTRCAHAFIHTTSNFVPARMTIFISGVVLIGVLLARSIMALAAVS